MQKAIDGSARDLVPYEVPMGDTDISIDFMDAADLETIEGGLRRLDGGIALLALIQGLGILKIEREGLWMQGGFHTLQGYREAQGKRLGMPRQTISNRRKCAEGFEDNRKLLAKVPLEGNVSKLALLNEALQLHEKKEVLVHFKADSYQEFLSWIRPRRILAFQTSISASRVISCSWMVMSSWSSLGPFLMRKRLSSLRP